MRIFKLRSMKTINLFALLTALLFSATIWAEDYSVSTENSLQNIEAGKPYLVGWPAEVQLEDITDPVFHGVTISTTLNPVETTPADAPEGTEVTFAEAYSPMMIGMERKNLLYLGADNTLYYPRRGDDHQRLSRPILPRRHRGWRSG